MKAVFSHIETLENRIAPASVLIYTDVDGDRVKITSSKGDLDGHAIFAPVGSGQQLLSLDLTDDSFAKTNLKITVKRAPGGDGFANVGFINAADNDLGHVRIKGDLGRIVAGDANDGTPAIKSLRVQSIGQLGTTTQGGTIGGGEIPSELVEIVGDLLGSEGGTGGLLEDVNSAISDLVSDGLLENVPDTVVRIISALQSNLDALLALTDAPGTLPGGATSLLNNVANLLSDLLGSGPEVTSLLGTDLTSLLTQTGNRIDNLLEDLLPNIGVGVDVGDLLGLDLGALLGINLGGILGGGGAISVGNLLGNLGTTLENLLGESGVGQIPLNVRSLLGEVDDSLDPILNGTAPLTSDVVALLSRLQPAIAGLLGGVDGETGGVTPVVGGLLGDVNELVSDLLAGGDGTDSASAVGLASDIRGDVRLLHVNTGVRDVFLNIQGDLRKAVIRGDLAGDELVNGGQLFVAGNLGSLLIGKNLIGGEALNSGNVTVNGKVGSIKINGSIIGAEGVNSGAISLQGDVRNLYLRGNLTGGEGMLSGSVVNENGHITNVQIRGALIAGDGDDAGTLRVSDDIARLRISGGIIGDSEHRAVISAGGLETKQGTKNRAFGQIRVGGSAHFADILAGYDTSLRAVNGDAQVGSVRIGRDWIASSISAGVVAPSGDASFGASNNTVISAGDTDGIVSRIASIQIKGSVVGTPEIDDQYGFVAEEIGKMKVGKSKLPLTAGANNDVEQLSQATGDVVVREVGTSIIQS